jgi:subtilisin family serine protease
LNKKLFEFSLILGLLITVFVVAGQTSVKQPGLIKIIDVELEKVNKTFQPAIYLKSRTIVPGIGIDPGVRKRLESLPLDRVHVLIYIDHIPTQEEREELKKNEILLLAYISNNGWFASVPKERLDEVVKTPPVRWVGEILPEDKISTYIQQDKFGPWAINKEGIVTLVVQFYKDIPISDGREIIKQHKGVAVGRSLLINALVVTFPRSIDQITELAKEDDVQWIEQIPPPLEGVNDESRAVIGVNTVQAPPYNLSGNNITLLVYDSGRVDFHPDFGGRVTWGNMDLISDHSTHVAGTAAGDGNLSNGTYRGMAPKAKIISYGTIGGAFPWFYNDTRNIELVYNESINNYSADLGTNSVAANIYTNAAFCALEGDYDTTAQFIDNITIGGLGRPFINVWAAGNERGGGAPCGQYNTVAPTGSAKNNLVVGATDSDDNAMMVFSSWGPTDDGRIKPDVVAPGCQNNSFYSTNPSWLSASNESTSIWSTIVNTSVNFPYYGMCGTSMATPAVSGGVALMLESYNKNYNNDPLPSTVKAILIQTATDLHRNGSGTIVNDGPDFTNGWGLVNATRAVDLIQSDSPTKRLILERSIENQSEIDYYNLKVPSGSTEIKVTLVWDDFPGVPGGVKTLQNDLDLTLSSPSGGLYFPWVLNESNVTQAATTGTDDLNNVEQIRVFNSGGLQDGTWKVKVKGSTIPEPPQGYSLIASFGLLKTKPPCLKNTRKVAAKYPMSFKNYAALYKKPNLLEQFIQENYAIAVETKLALYEDFACAGVIDVDLPDIRVICFEEPLGGGLGPISPIGDLPVKCPPLDCVIDGPGCMDPYQYTRVFIPDEILPTIGLWSEGLISDVQFVGELNNMVDGGQIKVEIEPKRTRFLPKLTIGMGVLIGLGLILVGFAINSIIGRMK